MNDQEKQTIEDFKNTKAITWTNNLFDKIKGKVLIYVIVGLLLIIGIWYYIVTRQPSIDKETIEKNEVIQKSVDSLLKQNLLLEGRINELEQRVVDQNIKVDKNNAQIQKNNSELNKVKKQYNEKIIAVDSFNTDNLDSFFTNRYH